MMAYGTYTKQVIILPKEKYGTCILLAHGHMDRNYVVTIQQSAIVLTASTLFPKADLVQADQW